jgi:hypothetical protein
MPTRRSSNPSASSPTPSTPSQDLHSSPSLSLVARNLLATSRFARGILGNVVDKIPSRARLLPFHGLKTQHKVLFQAKVFCPASLGKPGAVTTVALDNFSMT